MYEEELLEKIKKSSEGVKIPEELKPEEIEKMLNSRKKGSRKWMGALGSAAAAVLLLCCVGVVYKVNSIGSNYSMTGDTAYEAAPSDSAGNNAGIAEGAPEESPEETVTIARVTNPKRDAGDLYQVAEDYTQVYQALEPPVIYETGDRGFLEKLMDSIFEPKAASEGAASNGAAPADIADNGASTSGTFTVEMTEAQADKEESGSYSKTNVQTEGVDESDIVKTDGRYIYTVSGSQVTITDIQERNMEVAGHITVGDSSSDVYVREMYVDGDKLNLIVQKEQTTLHKGDIQVQPLDPKYGTAEEFETDRITEGTEEVLYAEPLYEGESYELTYKNVTELQTYDISDRSNPKLAGTVAQDGWYQDSRKIGDIVYLFTENYMEQTGVKNEELVTREEAGGFIPLVNGEMIEADCIYLPEYGRMGYTISSTNIKAPSQIIDNVLILNDYAQIYVSKEAIYLYHMDYSQEQVKTRIAKFSLKKGEINAVNAASVTGEVYDTFAVAEEKGNLRILTTDWSGSEDSNNLYLLDGNLNITGKLEGIAKGERIYAARFLGDVAYFVTYRNTDPLFAVDLSDEKNPKILSEVKLSGFSEYLHFWGENKLVGIGYETNEETGAQEGIKLVLFDISDPANVKIQKEFVIENGHYSPALYQYKTVLADPEENLLGFEISTYQDYSDKETYLLFSIEGGMFHNLLTADIDDSASIDEYRGIYAGDTFYLASPKNITSFDRKQNYQKIQKLEL